MTVYSRSTALKTTPMNVTHGARILEDSIAIEVFSPARADHLPKKEEKRRDEMRQLAAIVGLSLVVMPAMAQQVGFSFSNSPLSMVLNEYSEWTGKKVEIVRGVDVAITMQTTPNLTAAEAAGRIAEELTKNNVGLFAISSNRLVAAWIDTSKVPPPPERMSYSERVKRRREQLDLHRKGQEPEHLTEEKGKRLLGEYQMDLIRAKGAKGAPLPIPLTREQDDQLVSEGILPPVGRDAEIGDIQRSAGGDSTNRANAVRLPLQQ